MNMGMKAHLKRSYFHKINLHTNIYNFNNLKLTFKRPHVIAMGP